MPKYPAFWLFALLALAACNDKPSVDPNPIMEVFPNPSSGAFNVMLNEHSSGLKKLHVYDTRGKQILETDLTGLTPGQNHIAVNIADSPPGYFFVVLETATGNHTTKVLKQ